MSESKRATHVEITERAQSIGYFGSWTLEKRFLDINTLDLLNIGLFLETVCSRKLSVPGNGSIKTLSSGQIDEGTQCDLILAH